MLSLMFPGPLTSKCRENFNRDLAETSGGSPSGSTAFELILSIMM